MPVPPVLHFENGHGDGSTLSSTLESDGWSAIAWTPTDGFNADQYGDVMVDLIRNPDRMSSHLFRADIYYDSDSDKSLALTTGPPGLALAESKLIPHLKAELRPLSFDVAGCEWDRSIVRNLVPRNRNVDAPTVQTCHFLTHCQQCRSHKSVIVYLPHITDAEKVPFYHPKVEGICFVYTAASGSTSPPGLQQEVDTSKPSITEGNLAVYVLPFASTPPDTLQPKLGRTVQRMLETISKHARGLANGYQKRVHHDQVVPQRRYQETYARLKGKYARRIITDWKEVTDPGKHVFEDLGIAAFLIELWRDMYGSVPRDERDFEDRSDAFPGFVDIGCGNGLLVYLLKEEGYDGWGFDVRRRKSWAAYAKGVQESLQERILVPSTLDDAKTQMTESFDGLRAIHGGVFRTGTFVISNHADELTAWTPLIAYLNDAPFIAIPCCSHDLDGSRFRAPGLLRSRKRTKTTTPTVGQASYGYDSSTDRTPFSDKMTSQVVDTRSLGGDYDPSSVANTNGVGTTSHGGALKAEKSDNEKPKTKQSSAYASLCQYVSQIAEAVGYVPETEMLRIPSTRNACIVGRRRGEANGPGLGGAGTLPAALMTLHLHEGGGTNKWDKGSSFDDVERGKREEVVRSFVTAETGVDLGELRRRWMARAGSIAGKKSDGH